MTLLPVLPKIHLSEDTTAEVLTRTVLTRIVLYDLHTRQCRECQEIARVLHTLIARTPDSRHLIKHSPFIVHAVIIPQPCMVLFPTDLVLSTLVHDMT